MTDVDIRNLPEGSKARATENISVGQRNGVYAMIPAGEVVEVLKAYDPYTDDTAYRVRGMANDRHFGTGIAYHDELELV